MELPPGAEGMLELYLEDNPSHGIIVKGDCIRLAAPNAIAICELIPLPEAQAFETKRGEELPHLLFVLNPLSELPFELAVLRSLPCRRTDHPHVGWVVRWLKSARFPLFHQQVSPVPVP